ncbi:RimJ/RimL family protein N-acetyltransferase [Novosphingobium kunmingense]|uniref:RimJ/RimL family protein N-acetyltransferase n=1 Tax=Novosphingobium kunmingense TaxID=1211806 RepID=A0A2N0H544_9SPHN|nr:GNAT family N-acetyltransferase [Novosphingobium kunmingense]PKB14044.1 RimJ/RimL family protein N-acetyltransferase [Novosphingobium kunmingense]
MIATSRLVLRSWRGDDLDAFHAINSDPEVMATLGPVMSRDEVAALIARMQAMEARDGHCFWALERTDDARLIGWCGVIRGTAGPVEGKAEIGWRLARAAWGQGFASEAAVATIEWVQRNLPDPDVWAITATVNTRSRAVMERLGMHRRPGLDFDHPSVPEGSPLRPHVTYSLELPR